MPKKDRYVQTKESLRVEAAQMGVGVKAGATSSQIRAAILARADQNYRHNLPRWGKNVAPEDIKLPENCPGCH